MTAFNPHLSPLMFEITYLLTPNSPAIRFQNIPFTIYLFAGEDDNVLNWRTMHKKLLN